MLTLGGDYRWLVEEYRVSVFAQELKDIKACIIRSSRKNNGSGRYALVGLLEVVVLMNETGLLDHIVKTFAARSVSAYVVLRIRDSGSCFDAAKTANRGHGLRSSRI
ncbi:MAG: hypothetical protein CM1200mP41_24130 [Gammaproteobacteria bacterium]|nr:MAG: hypothetical protein CM1200mP41_24130 [Gammaproteobacteria bacterium]